MKKYLIIISSIIFFLLVNSSRLWEKLPGLWDLFLSGLLFIGFIILAIILIVQSVKLIKNRFTQKLTIINCILLSTVLFLTVIFPFGLIDFNKFEEPNLILAQYEGSANCTTTLKIKDSDRFIQRSICFGVDEYYGKYEIIGDTIKLYYDKKSSFDSEYAFGVIMLDSNQTDKKIGRIIYYRDTADDNPLPMRILEYKLSKMIDKPIKENTDTLIGYKKYNTEYDYYLDIFNQEKLIESDDILMLSITDSLLTKDKENELFYFIVFTKSMNGSDGFYSEAVGLSCFNFITKNPIRFAKYFLSEKKLNDSDFNNWAGYIYGEIQISRENQELVAIRELEDLLKEKVKDSNKEYTELIDKLIDEIKTAHNK